MYLKNICYNFDGSDRMDKKNKIILLIIVFVTIIVVGVCAYAIINHEKENQANGIGDALKFKKEYEDLNGKVNSNNDTYPTVTISENNTVKYITDTEAVELLKEETGVIYFGFSSCPWCRSMITTLTNVAKENKTTIYYLDISSIRSKLELTKDENSDEYLVSVKNKGTDSYYILLELLDSKLSDYYLIDENGKKYDTKEKRLYAPTVVAFDKGKIKGFHEGTVDSQENGYAKLTEKQETELNKKFTTLVKSIKNSCSSIKC